MNWPPWRRHVNGEARQAIKDAEDAQTAADKQTPKVERTAKAAKDQIKRTDRFAREVERQWRPRETP